MTLTELANRLDEMHAKIMDGVPTHDMDGGYYHYDPTEVEQEIDALARQYGYTGEQVQQELQRLDEEAMQ